MTDKEPYKPASAAAGFTTRPELAGTFGAVASTHWIASAVGMKILETGANAFDAAVAVGFVLQIVEPHLNGPGGDAPILAARHDDDAPTVICGQGGAPGAATIEAFERLGLELIPGTGLLAACVPGAFGAWLTLLRDWGTISLRAALEPAIGYAVQGHPILGSAVRTIRSVESLFRDSWPTSAATFLKNGVVPEPGDLFRNPVLGALYADIVQHAESAAGGREAQIDAALAYWYEGRVADEIGRFCATTQALDVSGRRHAGLLTGDDLAGWRPGLERAVSVDFADHRVFKCGAWSQGPTMLQALNILQGCDLETLDDEGPEFVHLVTEALKLAFADRDAWYGDTPDVPLDRLLSRPYADERRALIGGTAMLDVRPGSIGDLPPQSPLVRPSGSGPGSAPGGGEPTFQPLSFQEPPRPSTPGAVGRGDTCHVDVVDRWGNTVSATPSGGWLQSSPVVPALGFALGTRLQMFWLHRGHPNSLLPGKRPRTTLSPSMAFRDGSAYLAFGTPGGDQQEQWSLLLFLRHVLKRQPLQRAIDAPAFHTDHLIGSFWPREFSPGSLILEGRFTASAASDLRRRGHVVEVGEPWSQGRLSACAFDRAAGPLLRAAANPRGMQGYAIAR